MLELHNDLGALNAALTDKARIAIEDDGADVIVLGCTGFLGCAESMREGLLKLGYDVPVIDPIPITVHIAEALIKTGLSHSKVSTPPPSIKHVEGFNIPRYIADDDQTKFGT